MALKSERVQEEPGSYAANESARERLLAHGSSTLSDAELVSVLLRSGRPGVSALELAHEILEESAGISGLAGSVAEPIQVSGVGAAKTASLSAAVELARRIARANVPKKELLSRPETVARYLSLRYSVSGQEVMGALYLDTRNRLIAEKELFRGTLNRAAVEPRAVLRHGLVRHAAALVLFHTHPSGDPSPSIEDLTFTRQVDEAGDLVGIRLVDHLVLGDSGRWVSMRQRGGW